MKSKRGDNSLKIVSIVVNIAAFMLAFIPSMFMAEHLIESDILALGAALIGTFIIVSVAQVTQVAADAQKGTNYENWDK